MKNSKEYSKKIAKLYRSLKRKYPKVKPVNYDDPTEAVVYGTIAENMTQADTDAAAERIAAGFVDFNDLRVSLIEEIAEAIGKNTLGARTIANSVKRVLNAIFQKFNTISTQSLKKMGKRPARGVLEKIDGATGFTIDYCMLTSLNSHAIPLTEKMIEFLKKSGLVHPEAEDSDIAGFLARQISAENAYDFYALLRKESESDYSVLEEKTSRKPAKKKAVTRPAEKKTRAKTARKKSSKKTKKAPKTKKKTKKTK